MSTAALTTLPVRAPTAEQASRLLLAPWQWRRNEGSLWALRLYSALMVLVLGVPAVAALVWMPTHAAWVTVGACVALGCAWLWGVQISGLLRLDHPHAAHTVPGHAHALRAVAVGLWAGLTGICGLLAAVGAGLLADQGEGLADGVRLGLLVALGQGTLLLVVAWVVRWWWLWVPLCVGPSFLGQAGVRRSLAGSWAWVQHLWLAHPVLVTLALLLLQAFVLQAVFGRGGHRHARAYADRERMRKIVSAGAVGQQPGLASYGRWGEILSLPTQRLADAWLAHVCRHAQATQRQVMTRAEVVLHGRHHWVLQLAAGLLAQAVVVGFLLMGASFTGPGMVLMLEGGRIGIGMGITSMAVSAVLSLPGALWQSRREQALLVLLPGMPQGAALTQAVARRQWRQCLVVWLTLLPALAFGIWAGLGLSTLACVAVAVPVSAWLWRDWSRMAEPRSTSVFAPLLVSMAASGLSNALLGRYPQALLPWAAGLVLVTAGLMTWRWRQMALLPRALPVGRLA